MRLSILWTVIGAWESAFHMFIKRTGSSWGGRVDGYCDRLSPVSLGSLRSLRKKNQRSDGNHWSAIAVKTITEIQLFVSQRSLSLRSLESGFHMIAMIAAIAAITAMVVIIWKLGFNLMMVHFKRKYCLQRNLYLNCLSLWKSLER